MKYAVTREWLHAVLLTAYAKGLCDGTRSAEKAADRIAGGDAADGIGRDEAALAIAGAPATINDILDSMGVK